MATFVTVTEAPGITASLVSRTVPAIVPRASRAPAEAADDSSRTKPTMNCRAPPRGRVNRTMSPSSRPPGRITVFDQTAGDYRRKTREAPAGRYVLRCETPSDGMWRLFPATRGGIFRLEFYA